MGATGRDAAEVDPSEIPIIFKDLNSIKAK
jgi:hypothetical protein